MQSLVVWSFLLLPATIAFAQDDRIPPFVRNIEENSEACFKTAILESTLETWMPTYVQRDVRLSAKQKSQLEAEFIEIAKHHYNDYCNKGGSDVDSKAKEALRRSTIADRAAALRSAVETALEPTQLLRLQQIEMQANIHGLIFSHGSADLEKALSLSDEQKARLELAATEIHKHVKAESEMLFLKLMRIELDAVLTDEQRSQADELLGEPLAVSADK